MDNEELRQAALRYHAEPQPGKLSVTLTKPTSSQKDLSLAYTPGVAVPVMAIAENPQDAYRYTAKGNLVAVMTNGTAVLGLGNVGALASKPVMEGKAVLFKRFADLDVFDIEINESDPKKFVEIAKAISPTFGGINLEDIKAPECFEIEASLQEQLQIPVFHDDQHGTAIVVAAGLLNAVELQGKSIESVKLVCVGAGSAGIASLKLLVKLGLKKENILLLDSVGVVHSDRSDLNSYKAAFAVSTPKRTLEEAMAGADVFIGVAKEDLLNEAMVKSMAEKPIIFALSNPNPEIRPSVAHAARHDLIMATGRSDYPNQINNVLCFPYIFRGALDVKAKRINPEMQIAAVHAIRAIAREAVPEEVLAAYPEVKSLGFGPDYIIPKPMDPRLRKRVSEAVAQAAIATGVANLG